MSIQILLKNLESLVVPIKKPRTITQFYRSIVFSLTMICAIRMATKMDMDKQFNCEIPNQLESQVSYVSAHCFSNPMLNLESFLASHPEYIDDTKSTYQHLDMGHYHYYEIYYFSNQIFILFYLVLKVPDVLFAISQHQLSFNLSSALSLYDQYYTIYTLTEGKAASAEITDTGSNSTVANSSDNDGSAAVATDTEEFARLIREDMHGQVRYFRDESTADRSGEDENTGIALREIIRYDLMYNIIVFVTLSIFCTRIYPLGRMEAYYPKYVYCKIDIQGHINKFYVKCNASNSIIIRYTLTTLQFAFYIGTLVTLLEIIYMSRSSDRKIAKYVVRLFSGKSAADFLFENKEKDKTKPQSDEELPGSPLIDAAVAGGSGTQQ
ncbi:MAG: hypothetical protein MHMPM18_001125 [Marteilia pararefringens]